MRFDVGMRREAAWLRCRCDRFVALAADEGHETNWLVNLGVFGGFFCNRSASLPIRFSKGNRLQFTGCTGSTDQGACADICASYSNGLPAMSAITASTSPPSSDIDLLNRTHQHDAVH